MTSEIARVTLTLHNDLRAQHNAPPLQWSYELEKAATAHATSLLSRKPGDPLASARGVKWGQNVFELKTNSEITDKMAVEKAINDSWYKERQDYNPNVQSGTSGLNFSQLVWKNTQRVGLGVARKPEGHDTSKIVVVAFYDPSGNFRGEFAANVTAHKSNLGATSISTPSPYSNSSGENSTWNKTTTKMNTSSPRTTTTEWKSTPGGQESTSTWRTTTTTTTTSRTSGTKGDDLDNFKFPTQSSTNSSSHHVRFNSQIPTKSTTTTTSTSKDNGSAQDIAVQLHNEYRRKHGAPSVKLDSKLNEEAQAYARSIVMGNNQTKENLGVGRNVYRITTTGTKMDHGEAMRKAVTKWYSQAGEYNWNSPLASGFGANLWSQLVWKASTSIGVGVASKDDIIAVVVLYSPPGNIASEESYRANVSPAVY